MTNQTISEAQKRFSPDSTLNHFERFDLPVRYELDSKHLENEYLNWSKELHPDFQMQSNQMSIDQALEWSSVLNKSYKSLKSFRSRADHLLEVWGGPSASEHDKLPDGFLETVFEIRMEIDEWIDDPDSNQDRIEQTKQEAIDRQKSIEKNLNTQFAGLEDQNDRTTRLIEIRESMNTLKYWDRILETLRNPTREVEL